MTGIFIVLIFYNLSANLKFLYLDIKNKFAKDDKYLAVITSNGLWIKDVFEDRILTINASKIDENYIVNVYKDEKIFNYKKKSILELLYLLYKYYY